MKKLLFVLLLIFLDYSCYACNELERIGKVYQVVEPNMLSEIYERVKSKNIDIKQHITKERIKNYKPDNLVKLKKAKEPRTFTVDLTYTLEFDIVDGSGNIIYPKGFVFNPLDYVTLHNPLIVINGTNTNEVKWFEKSEYQKKLENMLLITDGSYFELSSRLKRPVFYADRRIIERFKLDATPSIVIQKGNLIEVKEIVVSDNN